MDLGAEGTLHLKLLLFLNSFPNTPFKICNEYSPSKLVFRARSGGQTELKRRCSLMRKGPNKNARKGHREKHPENTLKLPENTLKTPRKYPEIHDSQDFFSMFFVGMPFAPFQLIFAHSPLPLENKAFGKRRLLQKPLTAGSHRKPHFLELSVLC